MSKAMSKAKFYQVQEFAQLVGVSVRTLHHYDDLGLLKPKAYTKAGYRLYGESELVRLQQILTLKFLGFSLKEIKSLLSSNSLELSTLLRLQREAMKEKLSHLNKTIVAIETAENIIKSTNKIDWQSLIHIIEVINMQNNMDFVKQYYSQQQLDELAKRATPEILSKAQQDWSCLIKDVETAVANGLDPSSQTAQELASRWSELIFQFTQGDAGIEKSLKNLYSDQANWPNSFKNPCSDQVSEFISKAMSLHKIS